MCFMIQNAQMEITLKAGGLINMNGTTVLNVSSSFLMFVLLSIECSYYTSETAKDSLFRANRLKAFDKN